MSTLWKKNPYFDIFTGKKTGVTLASENRLKFTEWLPFYHFNILEETMNIEVERKLTGQKVPLHIDLKLSILESRDEQSKKTNVKAHMTSWKMHEENEGFKARGGFTRLNHFRDKKFKDKHEAFKWIAERAIQFAIDYDEKGRQATMQACRLIPRDVWGVIYRKGEFSLSHNHYPSAWSFGYYIQMPKGSAPVVFPGADQTIYPKEGDMIVFPGWVQHEVPANKTEEERIMIAGNIIHEYGIFHKDGKELMETKNVT